LDWVTSRAGARGINVIAMLDNLSLLMKGEVLPADTYWRGIPARRAGEG
jgi:hypothetical protein